MGIGGPPQPPISPPQLTSRQPGHGVYYPLLTPFIKVEWNDDSKQIVIKLYIAQLPPSPRHNVPFINWTANVVLISSSWASPSLSVSSLVAELEMTCLVYSLQLHRPPSPLCVCGSLLLLLFTSWQQHTVANSVACGLHWLLCPLLWPI